MIAGGFLPLHTRRLTLRAFASGDATAFAEYRNDPEVARYQGWDLPVSSTDAAAFVASQQAVTGPVPGDWVQIAIDCGGELVGDVAVGLDGTGAQAMIGFTLRRDRQRLGIGREAVAALVAALFAHAGVHRITATLDPRNSASARLVEHLGFRYEGCAKAAAAVRGEWLDDDCYALLREDRREWLARPTGPPADVRLVKITLRNVVAVARLATHHSQERFVSTMADSFRDALVPAAAAPWLRAIAADSELAGFVMLDEPMPAHPEPFLWRLLIDRRHQRRGIGSRAIRLLADRLRADGHRVLRTSWLDQPGGPGPFHRGLGFVPGNVLAGKVQAALALN
jgi:RimJ/RimL family protein N-acetyltransferase